MSSLKLPSLVHVLYIPVSPLHCALAPKLYLFPVTYFPVTLYI